MANWLRDLYSDDNYTLDTQQGQLKPYGGLVSTVSGDNERLKMSNWSQRNRDVGVNHPFVSSGSWMRALPESGAVILATGRADLSEPQIITTVTQDPVKRIDNYKKRNSLYRPLAPGELELSSSGYAQVYLANRAFLSMRAGVISRYMDQDKLLIQDKSPIHQKTLYQYKASGLGDEYRLGIVSRPKDGWQHIYPKLNGNYMAEEFIELKNPSNQSPAVLFREQRGHVVDIKGQPIKQAKTSQPLRMQQKYFAKDDTTTSFEIDELGNYLIQVAQAGAEGMFIDIPNGNFRMKVKKDHNTDVEANRTSVIKGVDSTDVSSNKKTRVAKVYSIDTPTMAFTVSKELTITHSNGTSIRVTSAGNVEIKSTKDIILNGQSGEVLTTMTDPVVDFITGVPTTGVFNVRAGL